MASPWPITMSTCSASTFNCCHCRLPHQDSKVVPQQDHSRELCDTRPAAAMAVEVLLPPLQAKSQSQISQTSHAKAVATAQHSRTHTGTTKCPAHLQGTPDRTKAMWRTAAEKSTQSCSVNRNFCWNMKMPLRRLILTIMAAVVFSMEFTICSTSVINSKLTPIAFLDPSNNRSASSNNNSQSHVATHLSTNITANKSAEFNGGQSSSSHVAPTTLPLPSSPVAEAATAAAAAAAPSATGENPVKAMESAALTQALLPTSLTFAASPLGLAGESSSFFMSSLTSTTLMHGDPTTIDDANASDELLSYPTSVLSTYNGSELPPLTEAEQAAKDLLTKGFSIPTYLPPFPVFAVADLPAYLSTVSSTTTEAPPGHHLAPDGESSQENLLYYDGRGELQLQQNQHRKLQTARRNSSLAGINNVTVQEGSHAYLPCRIARLQNKPVSWVRKRDGHIISVDQTTFIADQRFQAIFQDDKEFTWSLQIKYVQPSDEGWYECQASSEPKMSARVYLKVIVPLTELIGDQSRFVKAGSQVALHCIVRGTLDPPQYIIWYRDKTQINEDNKMGWYTELDRNIFGHNSDNENTIGSLIIPSVRKMDSGNYTCQPSNSMSVSVDLHVLSGEYSASAIMSAARTTYSLSDSYLLLLMLLLLLHKT